MVSVDTLVSRIEPDERACVHFSHHSASVCLQRLRTGHVENGIPSRCLALRGDVGLVRDDIERMMRHRKLLAESAARAAAKLASAAASISPLRRQLDDSISRATVRIEAASNPNLLCSAFKGADAPKVCMPITRPFGPM